MARAAKASLARILQTPTITALKYIERMGFPDSYQIDGGHGFYKQIGNAVGRGGLFKERLQALCEYSCSMTGQLANTCMRLKLRRLLRFRSGGVPEE